MSFRRILLMSDVRSLVFFALSVDWDDPMR